MELEERTSIDATPEDVFGFFEDMAENYKRWHPNHITFRWVDGDGLEPGATSYFEEEIGGEHIERTVEYVTVEPGRRIEMRPTSRLIRLFLPSIAFSFEPESGGCLFVQRIRLRMGPIAAWLNRGDLEAVRQHMAEEGENLQSLLTDTA